MRRDSVLSFFLRDADDTHQLGCVLGDVLASETRPRDAAVVLLSGELGAGKTSLARGLAEGLGVDPMAVASPTFTLRMDHRGNRELAHLDAWRIVAEDLGSVGFEELLAGDAVVAIEWPERIASALPTRHLRIRLEHVGEPDVGEDGGGADGGGRLATIDAGALPPERAARILDALALLVRAPRVAPPHCPTCGRALEPEAEAGAGAGGTSLPFCSPRCRLADLGDWLAMRHRIAGAETPEFDE